MLILAKLGREIYLFLNLGYVAQKHNFSFSMYVNKQQKHFLRVAKNVSSIIGNPRSQLTKCTNHLKFNCYICTACSYTAIDLKSINGKSSTVCIWLNVIDNEINVTRRIKKFLFLFTISWTRLILSPFSPSNSMRSKLQTLKIRYSSTSLCYIFESSNSL